MSEKLIDEAVNTTNMTSFLELLPHIEQPKINEERNESSLLDKALDKYNNLKENYFIALKNFRDSQIKCNNSIIIIQ